MYLASCLESNPRPRYNGATRGGATLPVLRYDRHGRKYSFIARWIFIEETISPEKFKVESVEERKTWYYSSPQPFEDELLAVLEKGEFEEKLFHVRNNLRPEILKQMAVTVQLTNEQKSNLFFKQFPLKTICFIPLDFTR